MDLYFQAWTDGFSLTGRASRSEYWVFTIFNSIIMAAAMMHEAATGSTIAFIITNVFGLLILIPTVTVTARRIHDTGRSGKILVGLLGTPLLTGFLFIFFPKLLFNDIAFMALTFVSTICNCWLLILMLLKGTPHSNAYGDPLGDQQDAHGSLTNTPEKQA